MVEAKLVPADVERDIERAENVLGYLSLSPLRLIVVLDLIVERFKDGVRQRIANTTGAEPHDGVVAWLVRQADQPLWWTGSTWTPDANQALRFVEKHHADQAIRGDGTNLWGAVAEEHMWTDGVKGNQAGRGPNGG